MKATRRLDRLSIIGGILAVVMLVTSVALTRKNIAEYSGDGLRHATMKCMTTPEMRADLELAAPWDSDRDIKSRLPALRKAVKDYPQSARLQFRLGMMTDGTESAKALEQVVRLDPKNALPFYILASKASSNGEWDESISLVKQANRLSRVDWYPLPYEGCNGDGMLEMSMISANSSLLISHLLGGIRRVSVDLTNHASSLYAKGKTREALVILGEVKKTGWTLIRKDEANALEVTVGVSIVQKAQKSERKIFTETNDQPGLAQIAREDKELLLLRAGSMAYVTTCNDVLVRRVSSFAAATSSVIIAGAVQIWLLLICLLSWAVLAVRSRGISASEYHETATERAFPGRRLVKVYALVFAGLAFVAAISAYLVATLPIEYVTFVIGSIGTVIPAIIPLVVLIWAGVVYRKSFKSTIDTADPDAPAPWKGYPIADKRERQRRLTGVCGGMMITLVILLAALSMYTKTTMNAYPWQTERATGGMYKLEPKYIADLVAGKVKVPEKYIKAEEKRQQDALKKAAKPGG